MPIKTKLKQNFSETLNEKLATQAAVQPPSSPGIGAKAVADPRLNFVTRVPLQVARVPTVPAAFNKNGVHSYTRAAHSCQRLMHAYSPKSRKKLVQTFK